MDMIIDLAAVIAAQFQKPTLSFLLGGMALAACGSRLRVPDTIYSFIVVVLLLKVGIGAGISIRSANLTDLLVPALLAALVGVVIVMAGGMSLKWFRGVSTVDAFATAGLFGAVSASTLAAAMAVLDSEGVAYEGFIGALYPFMDIAALLTAILVARFAVMRKREKGSEGGDCVAALGTSSVGAAQLSPIQAEMPRSAMMNHILTDTLKSPAISALLLGVALGALARPDAIYEDFYAMLFKGLLSILMLIMGMEAWQRLSELRRVAHAYLIYGLTAPFVHGLAGFGAGLAAHHITGFSAGGVVLLSVMAASSSDISGPPTLRASLPEANPSAYLGASTGLGTPIAIVSIPLWIALADAVIGF